MPCTLIDSEGNHVSVDADFSRAGEVHKLVKQALQIDLRKIDDDLAIEGVASTMMVRFPHYFTRVE